MLTDEIFDFCEVSSDDYILSKPLYIVKRMDCGLCHTKCFNEVIPYHAKDEQ